MVFLVVIVWSSGFDFLFKLARPNCEVFSDIEKKNPYFQYLAIIKKMNVLGCNDKFFNIFINSFVFIAAFSIAILHNMVPGRMSLNYFMCTGEDPSDYQYMKPKVI